MKRLIVIAAIVTGCAAPHQDIPEEARDMDGHGAAMVKMSFVQWLGQLVLTAVGNITVNVKIEGEKNDSNN